VTTKYLDKYKEDKDIEEFLREGGEKKQFRRSRKDLQ